MSIVSVRGILVKRLSTSKDIRNLLEEPTLFNSLTKEKESETVYSLGIIGLSREHKYLAKL